MTEEELSKLPMRDRFKALADELSTLAPDDLVEVPAGTLAALFHVFHNAGRALGYVERNSQEDDQSMTLTVESDPVLAILHGNGDPRDTEHVACDCLPKYGPPHCHLCGQLDQTPRYKGQFYGDPVVWPCPAAVEAGA